MNKNKIVRKRHSLYFRLGRPIARIIAWAHHYKVRSHFKIKKGESYLILSNHQTDFDGFLVMLSFNKLLYPVIADTTMSNGFTSFLLDHCFGVIPKKKGTVDFEANKKMLQVFDEGGSLLLFPEGNRTYAEFQYSFTKSFAKFIKNIKKPVIFYNIHGGTGCLPRFKNKKRTGPFYGKIRSILTYEEYKDMSDEELYEIVSNNLKVYDSESKCEYKSNRRAEYLERMFFVCPKCGKMETLVSNGNYIQCKECGFEAEYTTNLHLITNDVNIKFEKLLDWYNFQIRFIKDLIIENDKVLVSDNNVKLFSTKPYEKRKLLGSGHLELTSNQLTIGDFKINIGEIFRASPISGTRFNFSTEKEDYIVVGHERFNPLKYVFMFNKLETKMKQNNLDIHYNLEERKE